MIRIACLSAGVLGVALLCGACASDPSADPGAISEESAEQEQVIAMSESEGAYALEKKYAMDRGAVTYGEDGTVTGGKRSQFEGKRQIAFGGEWDGKQMENQQYEKTWWGGKKDKAKQEYAGNQDGSRFQAESLMTGKSASQSGKASDYAGRGVPTAVYESGSAREAGSGGVAKPTDVRTDWRRSVYPQPKITGYKQYQQMEVEQTRKLLGRE